MVKKKSKKDERYCLQRLIALDPLNKMETWKLTEWCDDKITILGTTMLGTNIRVFDTLENKEVMRGIIDTSLLKEK